MIAIVLQGCNQQLEEFVSGTGPKPQPQAPIGDADSRLIRRSAGAVTSTGGTVSMRAHLTPTQLRMTGDGISAQVGLGATIMK